MSEDSRKPEEAQGKEMECEGQEEEMPGEAQEENTAGGQEQALEEGQPENPDEAVSEEEAESESEDPEDTGEDGAGKKEKKDKKIELIEELTDRLQRSMAEFDNYRKRTEKEKASMYVVGAKEVVEKILPVVDNFERGLAAAQEGDAFAEGMQMVYKQLMSVLSELGVQPIEAAGQVFDPNLHNAVMHVEDPEVEENMVVEELQKGYLYKDFVVRHSMVKVAN